MSTTTMLGLCSVWYKVQGSVHSASTLQTEISPQGFLKLADVLEENHSDWHMSGSPELNLLHSDSQVLVTNFIHGRLVIIKGTFKH